jgi:hypothetical protein
VPALQNSECVTPCRVDCAIHEFSLAAIEQCMRKCKFGRVLRGLQLAVFAILVAGEAIGQREMACATGSTTRSSRSAPASRTARFPLGPLTTGEEMRTQTHNRSERGTRCYQEGRCTRPNSFLYDKDIADGIRTRFAATRAYRDASLWVTVQRRIVWIEGCVAPGYRNGQLDRLVSDVADVELIVVNVQKRRGDSVPYRRLDGRRGRRRSTADRYWPRGRPSD